MAFGTDPSGGTATLSGEELPVNINLGLASFTLSIDKAASGYVLLATLGGLNTTSDAFVVTGSITDTATVTSTLARAAAEQLGGGCSEPRGLGGRRALPGRPCSPRWRGALARTSARVFVQVVRLPAAT